MYRVSYIASDLVDGERKQKVLTASHPSWRIARDHHEALTRCGFKARIFDGKGKEIKPPLRERLWAWFGELLTPAD